MENEIQIAPTSWHLGIIKRGDLMHLLNKAEIQGSRKAINNGI
jgi:hypothetical protein